MHDNSDELADPPRIGPLPDPYLQRQAVQFCLSFQYEPAAGPGHRECQHYWRTPVLDAKTAACGEATVRTLAEAAFRQNEYRRSTPAIHH